MAGGVNAEITGAQGEIVIGHDNSPEVSLRLRGRWNHGIRSGCFAPDRDAISPGVQANRMRENRRRIRRAINDVVSRRAARRIQAESIPSPLRNFVVGAGRVTADSETADNLPILIKRNAAAEEDQAAVDFVVAATLSGWRGEGRWIEEVRLSQTIQRMSGLSERVQHCCR